MWTKFQVHLRHVGTINEGWKCFSFNRSVLSLKNINKREMPLMDYAL